MLLQALSRRAPKSTWSLSRQAHVAHPSPACMFCIPVLISLYTSLVLDLSSYQRDHELPCMSQQACGRHDTLAAKLVFETD